MRFHHDVTITLRWDAKQFEVISELLARGREDSATVTKLTGELKASGDALSEAVQQNQPKE